MELNDVIKTVEDRNKKINYEYTHDEGYEFCKQFLDKNNTSNIDGFMDMDIYEACKCLRYLYTKGKYSLESCCKLIDSCKKYLDELDIENFESFSDMVFRFSSMGKLDDVLDYLREENNLVAKSKLHSFDFDDLFPSCDEELRKDRNKWYHKLLREMRETQNEVDLAGLIEEARDNSDYLAVAMGLIEAQKRMKVDKTRFLQVFDETLPRNPNSTYAKKCLATFYKDNYKIKQMLSELEIIGKFVQDESYAETNHNNSVSKEMDANNRALDALKENSKNEEITNARSIVKKVRDADVKRSFLKYIYEHNLKYYEELNDQLDEIRKNTSTEYLNELANYKIIVSVDVVKQFMYNKFEDFKEILKIISKLPINENQILSILRFTNIEMVNKIDEYIKDGFLSLELVCNNISIFDPNCNIISTIDKNIELLSKYGLNPKLFVDLPDILLSSDDVLEKNIKYLEMYEFKGSIKTTNDYHFLLDVNMVDKMDRLIELGYATLLEKDLGLLNSPHLKRFELVDEMDISVTNLDSLRDILFNDSFVVNDDDLDSYLYNVLDYKEKFEFPYDISYLERNRFDKRRYLLNGFSISSNKVKRLLDEGYDMYDAIFHNVIMNCDEYDSLKCKLKIHS